MPLTRNHRIRRLHSSEVRPPAIPCSFPGCRRSFFNNSGLTHHIRKQHRDSRLVQHRPSASPISPPSSPPVVPPVHRRVGSYSSPSEISSPGHQNVTPLRVSSPNITVTVTPLSSPHITPLNSPILPINSPFDLDFPSSPPVQDGHGIDYHDSDHEQLSAGLPPNADQAHELENPVLPVPPLTKVRHSMINGMKACSIDLCN
jgi:hypothetical protein